jgi:phosphoserine phosphatase RsbU/P
MPDAAAPSGNDAPVVSLLGLPGTDAPIVDALNDAVIVAGLDGRIVYANAATERMLGWSPDTLLGLPVTTLVPERLRDAHQAAFSSYAATGEAHVIGHPMRLAALRPDGHEVPVELLLSTMPRRDGELIVATLRDVRERLDGERQTTLAQRVLGVLTAEPGAPEEVDARLLAAIASSLGWGIAAVWVLDAEAGLMRCEELWHDPALEAPSFIAATRMTPLARGQGLPGRVWERGEPAWVADLSTDPNFPRFAHAARDDIGTGLAFPLTDRGRLVGVIELFRREHAEPEPELLAALTELGARLGVWLRRTAAERELLRRAQRERAVANALRTSLLPPQLPSVPGVGLGAHFRPGGDVVVGGDFYDAFTFESQLAPSMGIAIGDVCGRGPEAAATTAQVRYTLRALAASTSSPSAALAQTNDALLARGDPETRFCTAVFGLVNREPDGLAVWVSAAGHPCPLVVRRDGSVEPIECGGTLLGVIDDGIWRDERVTLAEGESLVLYTDGVTEARRPDGEQFGEQRLVGLLREVRDRSAAEIVTAVEEAALEFSASSDDIAVLVVQATPAGR